MEATTRATLAGGAVTALVVGFSLATAGPRPALSLRIPGVLGRVGTLWVVGGLLGGGVAGALARDEFGASNWAFGARYGVAATGLGLVLSYLGHAAVVAWLAATGELPLHPLTMLTLVPLVVGLPVAPVQLFGGLLAGGLLGALIGDGTDEEEADADAASPEYDADRLERLREHARYAPDRLDHDALLSFLDSAAPEARGEAARAIATAPEAALEGFVDGFPRLVGLLEDDRSVRRSAAAALANLAGTAPDAVAEHADVLVGALSDPSARVRQGVTTALGTAAAAAPERVVEATMPLLEDGERTTRRAAATVLRDAARAEPTVVRPVAPALIETLDRGGFAREPLAEALAALAGTDPDAVAPAADTLTALARGDGPAAEAATEALARVAAADPDAIRDATPVLVDALLAAPDGTLAEGVVALGATDPETCEAIEERLREAGRWDRYRAARALADADDPGPAIATAVVDESLERYLDR